MFKTSYIASEKVKKPILGGFLLGYMGGLLALVIHSLAATTFTTIRTMEPFFFATGLLYVIHNQYVENTARLAPGNLYPEGIKDDKGLTKAYAPKWLDEENIFIFDEEGVFLRAGEE
jgi:hypothetical protein